MKVVFSFDDSVKDTYTVAYPILKKYKMPFTINVITKYVKDNLSNYMTPEQLVECQKNGVEIASHGHTHQNTKEDVTESISCLKDMGIEVDDIGFASPRSELTAQNGHDIKALQKQGKLSYIRSGIQIRREGFWYSALSYIERKTHSRRLFYILNKHNIIKSVNPQLLMSVAITKHTTLKQILSFLEKMHEDDAVILMFHHVVDNVRNADHVWCYDAEKFSLLCEAIKGDVRVEVSTTKDLVCGKLRSY